MGRFFFLLSYDFCLFLFSKRNLSTASKIPTMQRQMDGVNKIIITIKALFMTLYVLSMKCKSEEQTHHRSAVFHQVDSNNTQKCSKTQLEAQRHKKKCYVSEEGRSRYKQQQQQQQHTKSECLRCEWRLVTVTHSDAGVISSDRYVVCASGGDQTYSQHHQSQSQQRHGHPQSRLPPTQVLNWGRRRNKRPSSHSLPLTPLVLNWTYFWIQTNL